MTQHQSCTHLAASMGLMIVAGSAHAATHTWTASAGGVFSDPANWQAIIPAPPPGIGDQALFNLPATYVVSFNQNVTNNLLRIRGGDVTLDLGGFTYAVDSITNTAIVVGVSSGDAATLRITSSAPAPDALPNARAGSPDSIRCKAVTIGASAGASGTLILSGPHTILSGTGAVAVGQFGPGSLRVENGATLTSFNGFIGLTSGATATVTGAGSTWSNGNILDVSQTLIVQNGGRVVSSLVDVNAGAGRIIGDGILQGGVDMRGTALPGGIAQTGTLHVEGTYAQGNNFLATLAIELGGTAPGAPVAGYDVLAVTGTATIDKMLVVTLINGFVPPPGAVFDILTAGSVLGTFAQVTLPTLPAGSFTVQYMADRVRLIAPGAALPADLNGDGHVNGIDLALLLGSWTGVTAYSPCPRFAPADLNRDCKVDGIDLALLLGAWTG